MRNNISVLPGLEKLPVKKFERHFAFEAEESIFFISTNSQRNIVRYNLKDQSHRILEKSQIPGSPTLTAHNTYGFRLGHNFWVVKGNDEWDGGKYQNSEFDGSTWVWNIKKSKWFIGGFKLVGSEGVCYVPIGIVT